MDILYWAAPHFYIYIFYIIYIYINVSQGLNKMIKRFSWLNENTSPLSENRIAHIFYVLHHQTTTQPKSTVSELRISSWL